MKKEDLTKLGIADDIADQILAIHGRDIEKHKTATTTAQTEIDALKAQLAEASTAIESFKKLDIDGIKAAADEWKTKAEQAEAARVAEIDRLKFDHALDGALTGAKAKNAKAVKALLNLDNLKLADDGKIIGLDDQLKTVKESNDYLFDSDTPTPKIVAGGNNQPVLGDAVILAARRAAGLKVDGG